MTKKLLVCFFTLFILAGCASEENTYETYMFELYGETLAVMDEASFPLGTDADAALRAFEDGIAPEDAAETAEQLDELVDDFQNAPEPESATEEHIQTYIGEGFAEGPSFIAAQLENSVAADSPDGFMELQTTAGYFRENAQRLLDFLAEEDSEAHEHFIEVLEKNLD
ncbi:hypothetical protein [Salisediminibacterium halotolerans]|uniref:hypothetical protein n=1 Tax=Salisediminibacterium halotolerans TaxID=517425 RepID=UPI000EB3CE3E|nr:hypothetical protein [Salisediminibacterium halotolerans]RLJ78265.1 hypothetical protein BCL39_0736 [Actinophytocola xinjiangensis]RPE88396.1 hypothetical protein EDD67_0723 [Salisediminibacterium halotolerans]TWG37242.1 hypothetical protein BCL52_0735 [Salisediminibacterium halotolerans]GEL07722.1 hypothetical protein SHA02_11380 [Salisediminibacterium halotolerans]